MRGNQVASLTNFRHLFVVMRRGGWAPPKANVQALCCRNCVDKFLIASSLEFHDVCSLELMAKPAFRARQTQVERMTDWSL